MLLDRIGICRIRRELLGLALSRINFSVFQGYGAARLACGFTLLIFTVLLASFESIVARKKQTIISWENRRSILNGWKIQKQNLNAHLFRDDNIHCADAILFAAIAQ